MLTDNATVYLVNVRDVQKVLKKHKKNKLIPIGINDDNILSLLKNEEEDFCDDKGVSYYEVNYTGDYAKDVLEYVAMVYEENKNA